MCINTLSKALFHTQFSTRHFYDQLTKSDQHFQVPLKETGESKLQRTQFPVKLRTRISRWLLRCQGPGTGCHWNPRGDTAEAIDLFNRAQVIPYKVYLNQFEVWDTADLPDGNPVASSPVLGEQGQNIAMVEPYINGIYEWERYVGVRTSEQQQTIFWNSSLWCYGRFYWLDISYFGRKKCALRYAMWHAWYHSC